jgi:hypothetical protein
MGQFTKNQRVRVIAQDADDSAARVGDIGTVIGHEDSNRCVNVRFDGFTEWLWNYEVELIETASRAN